MTESFSIRRLTIADLAAYQVLREDMLAAYPEVFTSEAIADRSQLSPTRYSSRLGEATGPGSEISFGCFEGSQLHGAITLERDAKTKLHHTGHIIGMMVNGVCQGRGMGGALLGACIAAARATSGLEMLTLSVTASNQAAVALYAQAGFVRYGCLQRAIKIGDRYLDKDLMVLAL
jgi:RimJ/RimL family protein N-acetyltransferase